MGNARNYKLSEETRVKNQTQEFNMQSANETKLAFYNLNKIS